MTLGELISVTSTSDIIETPDSDGKSGMDSDVGQDLIALEK